MALRPRPRRGVEGGGRGILGELSGRRAGFVSNVKNPRGRSRRRESTRRRSAGCGGAATWCRRCTRVAGGLSRADAWRDDWHAPEDFGTDGVGSLEEGEGGPRVCRGSPSADDARRACDRVRRDGHRSEARRAHGPADARATNPRLSACRGLSSSRPGTGLRGSEPGARPIDAGGDCPGSDPPRKVVTAQRESTGGRPLSEGRTRGDPDPGRNFGRGLRGIVAPGSGGSTGFVDLNARRRVRHQRHGLPVTRAAVSTNIIRTHAP